MTTFSLKTAVLLLAHGSPDSPQDIPCFLYSITGGRPLLDSVVKEVQHRYSLIGRSPLREYTQKQAEGVQRELGIPVYIGMRNWEPYIRDVVPQMAADGIERAVVICLAPQNSRTSTGAYKKALLGETGQAPFALDFVESWHDHPGLIEAFADRLCASWPKACVEAGETLPIIFTAHSVPTRTITEGDPYEAQARETARLVAERACGLVWGRRCAPSGVSNQEPSYAQSNVSTDEAATALGPVPTPPIVIPSEARNPYPADTYVPEIRFAFQSQGMSGGTWLGPTVEETIESLQQQGHRGVFVQPIGFLCDHVEILYDIDIMFRQFAEDRGMKLYRAESLNDSPLLARALAEIVRKVISKS
ncbi:MAG TPA: ferrochelatase [Terriglobales bacterium]|nr:ferrochelatase [Terriglobales bacterium]